MSDIFCGWMIVQLVLLGFGLWSESLDESGGDLPKVGTFIGIILYCLLPVTFWGIAVLDKLDRKE